MVHLWSRSLLIWVSGKRCFSLTLELRYNTRLFGPSAAFIRENLNYRLDDEKHRAC
eukprot:UN00401